MPQQRPEHEKSGGSGTKEDNMHRMTLHYIKGDGVLVLRVRELKKTACTE